MLPKKELREKVEAAAIPTKGSKGFVVVTISNSHALQTVFEPFLESMDAQKVVLPNGTIRTMTTNLLVVTAGYESGMLCEQAAKKHGHQCHIDYTLGSLIGEGQTSFDGDHTWHKIGFGKVKLLLDIVTLGYDLLFLDSDVVVYKEIQPYFEKLGVDVAVPADECTATIDGSLPADLRMNIGVLYIKASHMSVNCAYRWWLSMHHYTVMGHGWPWDQTNFETKFLPCMRSLGGSVHLMPARAFPQHCQGACGCRFQSANSTKGAAVEMDAAGNCPADLVKDWFAMHVCCAGALHQKVDLMRTFQGMPKAVGLANSNSGNTVASTSTVNTPSPPPAHADIKAAEHLVTRRRLRL